MKTKTLFSALLTSGMLLSVSAFAQDHGDRYYPADNNYRQNDPRPVYVDNHRQNEQRTVYVEKRVQEMPMRQVFQQHHRWRDRDRQYREYVQQQQQQYYYNNKRYDDGYHGQRYVVNNWREHNLSAPPRGYQWVQSGPDFLLAAITNHIIMRILSH